MKKTISNSEFHYAFRSRGRGYQFSPAALDALFAYFEEYEESIGEEIELNVIAICCEWAEYDNATEAAKEYGWNDETLDADDDEREAFNWLSDRTTVLLVGNDSSDGVVIADF